MSDVGRKTVPDKGRLNREPPKPLSFLFTQKSCCCFFSAELERRVRNRVYTERQDDRYGGRVPSKKHKAKVGYLEKYPFFDWEPVKLFEKWCNMLMSAFAKNDCG